MLTFDADLVRTSLPWPELIGALRDMFASGCETPVRQHHHVGPAGETLLIMPAWRPGGLMGVKLVTVFPRNSERGLPSIAGLYALFDGETGAPLAVLDGGELTARRTAAASALAASWLARDDAATMTIVGTGRLSRNLVEAHASVRPIRKVFVWGRSPGKAREVTADLAASGFDATAASDLEAAVRHSDLVSCATLSREPLVRGAWLRPGCHLDLVGAFSPQMRETDADAWARADLIAVDTRDGARVEAGDILRAEAEGVDVRIAADLFDLARGAASGRSRADQITVFKSVGASLEDLAAAALVAKSVLGR